MLARILTTPALRKAAIQPGTLSYWVCVGFSCRARLGVVLPRGRMLGWPSSVSGFRSVFASRGGN